MVVNQRIEHYLVLWHHFRIRLHYPLGTLNMVNGWIHLLLKIIILLNWKYIWGIFHRVRHCQLILLDFNSIWRIFESRIGVSFRYKGTITNTIVILDGFAGWKFLSNYDRTIPPALCFSWYFQHFFNNFSFQLESFKVNVFWFQLHFRFHFPKMTSWNFINQIILVQ